MGQQAQRRYFTAVFGDQIGPPAKDSVDSGRYIPYKNWANYEDIGECDLILLYCTGSYKGYWRETPGIGVVVDVKLPAIYYCYLPLDTTISLYTIRYRCTTADKAKLEELHGKTLFDIERASFRSILGGSQINWP